MFDTKVMVSPGAAAAAMLADTDPDTLSDLDLVEYAQAAERQVAHANELSLRASLALARRATARVLADSGRSPTATRVELAERVGIGEVAQALRLSTVAAGNRVRRAEALAGPLAPAAAALAAGAISLAHVLVLLDHTEDLDAGLAAAMQARCLPRATRQTPGDFGRSLTRAWHALDPDGATARHRAARAHTGVRKTEGCDGMAALVITATDPDAEWAYTVLDTLARAALHDQHAPNGVAATPPTPQPAGSSPPSPDSSDGVLGTPPTGQSAGSAGPDGVPGTPPTGQSAGSAGPDGVLGTPPAAGRPSLDQVRAEVFFRLLDRAVTDPTFPTQHGRRRIETQVVIGLDTLLGLRDDPATINGRSVPAEIARELATGTTALRRLVTDPVTGHLLDYGTRREPPAVLTEYLLARDQECRVPHCHIRATASDLDHAVPREHGGPTNTSNLGALSRGHHTPKTAGWTDIVDSRADGSAVYVTILGQRIPIPPRPVLGDPPEPSPDTSTIGDDDTDATDNHHVTPDDDPPPF